MFDSFRSMWSRAFDRAQGSAARSLAARKRRPALEILEDRTVPTVYTVTTLADTVANDGQVSLREAIQAANTNTAVNSVAAGEADGDVINFSVTGQILLNSELSITDDVTINGTGITINNNVVTNRTLNFDTAAVVGTVSAVTLNNLIIDGGGPTAGDGGTILIASGREVVINSSTVQGGRATAGNGGQIANAGTLTLNKSTINASIAQASLLGDGIYNTGTLNLNQSTITGGSAGQGAGLYNLSGTATITQSAISGNSATVSGGGITVAGGTVNLVNSTVASNNAPTGGGINVTGGTLNVSSATIAKNNATAGDGGGVNVAAGTVAANNSVIGDNAATGAGADFAGAVTGNFNIIEVAATGGITGTDNLTGDAGLAGALASNGGPTQTVALLAGSAALDSGDAAAPGVDQRGAPRSQGAGKDRGAFEAATAFRQFVSLVSGTSFLVFDDDPATTVETTRNVTGMLAGEKLLSIDVRPADGKLYGLTDRNRIYTIDTTTGAATFVSTLSIGLNDGSAATFDQNLGLFVDEQGFYQRNGPEGATDPKWLRGKNNNFGNPWYYLLSTGEFYEWDGTGTAASPNGVLITTYSTAVYRNPERLYDAFSATATLANGGETTTAISLDKTLGLFVDEQGFFQSNEAGGGSNPKWLRGANNASNNPWYYLKVNLVTSNTELYAWDGTGTVTAPNGTLVGTFTGTVLFANPELLYNAINASNAVAQGAVSAGDLAAATALDNARGLFVDEEGFFQTNATGNTVKWLRGSNNSFNNPWYYLKVNVVTNTTEAYAWDGTGTNAAPNGTLIQTFSTTGVYDNPELLFNASSTTLAGAELAAAISLDSTRGLYVDEQGFFQSNAAGSGSNPKWLRGNANSFGNPWYALRVNAGNTELVEWDGTSPAQSPVGTVLQTFAGTSVFDSPELLFKAATAVTAPIGTGTLSATDKVGVDFNPTVDRLRIVTTSDQNLRVNVDTGAVTVDTAINPAARTIADVAYTNNLATASATTLYYIDPASDSLYSSAAPNGGTLSLVGTGLGIGDITDVLGFDIFSAGTNGDVAYAVLKLSNGTSKLYTINLVAGTATEVTSSPFTALDTLFSLAVLS